MNDYKFDQDKIRFDLVLPEWEKALAEVLTFGASKYESNSWQKVPDSINRYYAALRRHLNLWRDGETIDSDSGLPHLYHVLTNVAFLITLDKQNEKITNQEK